MYQRATIATGSILLSIEFALGAQTPTATVVHVRGVTVDGTPFAGALALAEDRGVPGRDLRSWVNPIDEEELAITIDQCLGPTEGARSAIRRNLE